MAKNQVRVAGAGRPGLGPLGSDAAAVAAAEAVTRTGASGDASLPPYPAVLAVRVSAAAAGSLARRGPPVIRVPRSARRRVTSSESPISESRARMSGCPSSS